MHKTKIDPEELAYWYLRLNGCFTMPNFVVHPETGSNQRTDIDVLAVRFPSRHELRKMTDDRHFRGRTGPLVILAEVKKGCCALNSSWLDNRRDALDGVLAAAGMFTDANLSDLAAALQRHGHSQRGEWDITFMAFGADPNPDLTKRYSAVPQILWPDVLLFIHQRFTDFRLQKASHAQWDRVGHELWNLYAQNREFDDFYKAIRIEVEPASRTRLT